MPIARVLPQSETGLAQGRRVVDPGAHFPRPAAQVSGLRARQKQPLPGASPFRLDLLQKQLVGPLFFMEKIRNGPQRREIKFETLPKLFRRRVVKERNVFVEIRDEKLIAQPFVMRHPTQPGANRRLRFAQSDDRFDIEHLKAARLEEGRNIAGVVIGRKADRLERRHLAGGKGALKISDPFGLPRGPGSASLIFSRACCSRDARIWSRRFASC